ncbi:hypothetical protein [Collimonas pratensis]|uniref:Uncharacterized protein n=1 Tax=Collimonas pratensis TaxID=279113 RepID=A0ABN4MI66_9BURK|nr:hypothetical protein [Collimonas pratensis]AMP16329.1 hypothetical protein CPter291_4096 [Collimonas pratensis]
MKKFIHQIYYNASTCKMLDPGFVALDNTANARPDWFEFWVILNFLRNNPLEENAWYGFFSPKFRLKTGLKSEAILSFLQKQPAATEVALFSPSWDQIAYFLNPFEQGEFWHPGLRDLSQKFCDAIDLQVDLKTLTAHSHSSVFSNYIVAKPAFWRQWQEIAEAFFAFIEQGEKPLAKKIGANTTYGSAAHEAPMKTFIQERIATLVLARNDFKVAAMDFSPHGGIFTKIFNDDQRTRRLLQSCDLLKQLYCESGDEEYLSIFRKTRALVPAKCNLLP